MRIVGDSYDNAKATTRRLYVDDDRLVEDLKMEALRKMTSISKLLKEWANTWLREETGRDNKINFNWYNHTDK